MRYTGKIRFYRIIGGPNGWQETVTCSIRDDAPPLTWGELQAWFALRMADYSEWTILNQEVTTI